jgi:molybdopterin-guanine dinucleotide biosynthesis protein A
MISEGNKGHQKHTKLKRPSLGQFGRSEIAILGTPCGNIKHLVRDLVDVLSDSVAIGFVDADHKAAEPDDIQALSFTDKISFRRFDYLQQFNSFQRRPYFNHCELVLVNGNHFKADCQIVVVDQKKPLDRKLDRLTNPLLVVKKEPEVVIPDYLQPYIKDLPILEWDNKQGVIDFVNDWRATQTPPMKGLVLAGGKSTRMKRDKGALDYHGVSQRQYLYSQLRELGIQTVISCRPDQQQEMEAGLPLLPDTFLDLGPMGALLSAFREEPDTAWLAIACDLPYLSSDTIKYLVDHRDTSKIATTFQSPFDEFPEPLITVWEPRSYGVLLSFLSQGYSCPRKVLINSDVKILTVPDPKDLSNINHPEEYQEALRKLAINK